MISLKKIFTLRSLKNYLLYDRLDMEIKSCLSFFQCNKGVNDMKKSISISLAFIVFVLACFLSGCSTDKPDTTPDFSNQDELKKVEQVGEVPENLRNVVKKNIFNNATPFDGRVLKTEISSSDEENHSVVHNIQMLDLFGNKLSAYSCKSDDAYHIRTLTATNDGGFLFVVGFEDYAYDQNVWASEKGFASRVIKCDASGEVQFDTDFESVDGEALSYCFEIDNKYYLFGTKETPETKTQGVYSPTDIYMTILDTKGNIIKTETIGGSDYDDLNSVKIQDGNFILSVSSQSNDGDFSKQNADGYSVDYVITVNHKLEIIQKERGIENYDLYEKIGERHGEAIYDNDALLKDYDAGTPTAYIEYEDFYLIVSENVTGEYEKTPEFISSIWYYTETVYSGYDYDGKLLFRASVDSTPDYDAKLKAWQDYTN